MSHCRIACNFCSGKPRNRRETWRTTGNEVTDESVEKMTGAIAQTRDKTMAYSKQLLDHYNNPRNVGSLDKGKETVGTGMVGAPECGDVMKLQIEVDDKGVIQDAKFKTFGCGSAIASSSLATEKLKGKTLDEAEAIRNTEIVEELALPPIKIHCSVLAEDAIKAAIADFRKKQAQARAEAEPAGAGK